MGITTRGGVARTLEYDQNDGLISKTESHTRIISLLLLSVTVLSLALQILILLFFLNLNNAIKNFHFVDNKPAPKLNYYLQSISTNHDVFLSPIILTSNKSLTTGSSISTYSFPKSDIQFGYHY